MKARILLIEDTETLQLIYQGNLTRAGYDVDVASSGAKGLSLFNARNYPVVVMDLFLPDMDGEDVLRNMMSINSEAKIIVITSNGTVNRAVSSMRSGAYDFLLKPFSDARLVASIEAALSTRSVRRGVNLDAGDFFGFKGRSPTMQEMYRKIMRIAPSKAPVFIVGEKGSGKDVCAHAIHSHGRDEPRPIIKFDIGSLTPSEQETSLLAGFDPNVPVGNGRTDGALVKARNGTLYINEVGEMDQGVQARLADLLQAKSQGEETTDPDGIEVPRILCASNIDPYTLLETGKIREDLFYQLHILSIKTHPLRELGEDILLIAQNFIQNYAAIESKEFEGLSENVSDVFLRHSWPGNMRQMGNFIRKIIAENDGPLIRLDMLPIGFASEINTNAQNVSFSANEQVFVERSTGAIQQLVGLQLDEMERQFIEATIEAQDGSVPKAAAILGVAPSTIYRKRTKQ